MPEITQMIATLVQSFLRATSEGKPPEEAARIAEIELRAEYAGERVYIAALPRERKIHQLRQLGTTTMSLREQGQALGIPYKTVARLKRSSP